MNNKGQIEMPFSWIFALIAGGIILFLAIYGASRFIGTGQQAVSTETSAKLVSLLDPFETGLASGKSSKIDFKKKSRIYFTCSDVENLPFGKNTIAFSEQTFGETYGPRGERLSVKNKYIFAENPVEGKNLYVFSMPFSMPFKVSDIIIIFSEKYCFYEAPNKVKEDIENMGISNINFAEGDFKNCSGMKTVCFNSNLCDINVEGSDGKFDSGKVEKKEGEIYFAGNLLYAAIFSDSEIYECNIKRLLNRFNELSSIYIDKIGIIESKGCSSTIGTKLKMTSESIKNFDSSGDLISIYNEANEIDLINKGASLGCRLYKN